LNLVETQTTKGGKACIEIVGGRRRYLRRIQSPRPVKEGKRRSRAENGRGLYTLESLEATSNRGKMGRVSGLLGGTGGADSQRKRDSGRDTRSKCGGQTGSAAVARDYGERVEKEVGRRLLSLQETRKRGKGCLSSLFL